MERPQLKTKEILNGLASEVRRLGFKGSRQNFRRADSDFIFVINFRKTSITQGCWDLIWKAVSPNEFGLLLAPSLFTVMKSR